MSKSVTPSQWARLQRGETVEILERMEPQPDFAAQPTWAFGPGHSGVGWYCGETEYPDEGSEFYGNPHAIGDKIAVRCPECKGWGEHEHIDVSFDCQACNASGRINIVIHSLTARQVGGVWHWAMGVKKEDA
jgi:hypothetical protein